MPDRTTVSPTDATAPEILSVQIVGLPARRLRSVKVCLNDGTALQVDSVSDGRLGIITAGALIDAMAKEAGIAGMTLDVATQRLTVESTSVRVIVEAHDRESAELVRVFLLTKRNA